MEFRSMPGSAVSALESERAGSEVKHIVDQLIAERATRLSRSPLWPVLRPIIYRTFHYRQAVSMANDIAPMSGWDALSH